MPGTGDVRGVGWESVGRPGQTQEPFHAWRPDKSILRSGRHRPARHAAAFGRTCHTVGLRADFRRKWGCPTAGSWTPDRGQAWCRHGGLRNRPRGSAPGPEGLLRVSPSWLLLNWPELRATAMRRIVQAGSRAVRCGSDTPSGSRRRRRPAGPGSGAAHPGSVWSGVDRRLCAWQVHSRAERGPGRTVTGRSSRRSSASGRSAGPAWKLASHSPQESAVARKTNAWRPMKSRISGVRRRRTCWS